MVGLSDGENTSRIILGTIPACDRQTDILPQHSPHYTYASRGKNWCGYPTVKKFDDV